MVKCWQLVTAMGQFTFGFYLEELCKEKLTTARALDVPNKSGTSGIESIRFSPDGTILALHVSAGIKLWDIEQPTHTGKATP